MLETDYLVVGAGAAGMAFRRLVARPPGGDVVRLHLPSACYGVNSLPLGNDTIDADGPNAG